MRRAILDGYDPGRRAVLSFSARGQRAVSATASRWYREIINADSLAAPSHAVRRHGFIHFCARQRIRTPVRGGVVIP
jgi:hypothetical protein